MNTVKILFIGEIVGKSGIFCVKHLLNNIKKKNNIDFVIANGEGATGGFGIGKNHSIYLRKLGIECITTGECVYYKKDMVTHIPHSPYILRPANYPYGNPGRGWYVYSREDDLKIGVINILGQSGFKRVHLSNPYLLLPELAKKMSEQTNIILVDFHASTTAEKSTMFYHMDGKVSAIIGTHTKAQSADEQILPGGTAVISEAGRTGSLESVGGFDPEIEIRKYVTKIHEYSQIAWDMLELQGVILEIDRETGKAVSIQRLRKECEAKPDE